MRGPQDHADIPAAQIDLEHTDAGAPGDDGRQGSDDHTGGHGQAGPADDRRWLLGAHVGRCAPRSHDLPGEAASGDEGAWRHRGECRLGQVLGVVQGGGDRAGGALPSTAPTKETVLPPTLRWASKRKHPPAAASEPVLMPTIPSWPSA